MSKSSRRLLGIRWSPWTIRARLALEHHQLPYDFEDYLPYLGEPVLRARLGFPRGNVSVPVLFDGSVVVTESRAIVLHADGQGGGSSLLPDGYSDALARWETRCDAACQSGRGRVTRALMSDPRAIDDELAPIFPRSVRRFVAPLAKRSIRYVHDKYDSKIEGVESARQRMRPLLDDARSALQQSEYLVANTLSLADLALIGALQGIKPEPRFGAAGDAKTAAWTDDVLAREYGDLLSWRDRLLARHELPRASRA